MQVIDAAASMEPTLTDARAAALRVLHVIDPRSPGGGACTLRLLADHIAATPAWDHVVALAGHRVHIELARRCGVAAAGSIPSLVGIAGRRIAPRALRQLLTTYESAFGRFDLIHAWTISSGDAARGTTSRRPILATIVLGPVDDAERRALRRVGFSSGTMIAAASAASQRECLDADLPRSRVLTIPAGVRLQDRAARPRASVRASWNASDHDFLVGLVGQPTSWSDARVAMSILAPLMAVPHPIRLVAFPGAARRVQAMQWIRRLGWPQRIILDDGLAEPWRVMAGLDAVLALDRGTMMRLSATVTDSHQDSTASHRRLVTSSSVVPSMSVLPALHAMAAARPVVTDMADDQLGGVLVDGRNGFRVLPNDLSAAMNCVLRLVTDEALRRRLGIAAREAVMLHASVEQFSSGVADLASRLIVAGGSRGVTK